MELSDDLKRFIREHACEDVAALLLKKKRYPEIDLPLAASQILARRQLRGKLPAWQANEALFFPSRLSAEQCSSELTARYKQRLVGPDMQVCDLTGGLGADSYYFSLKAHSVTYVERYPEYCEAARLNFRALGAGNIRVVEGDAAELAGVLPAPDAFYLDPARRGEGDKRVFALADCEPDLVQLKERLLERAPLVIAKISPMADLQHTCALLPETTEVHVLSVKNECKELLFVLRRKPAGAEPAVFCVNWTGGAADAGAEQSFRFTFGQERSAPLHPAGRVKRYLYEPNAAILKAGAFKRIALATATEKLHASSHLYTSDVQAPGYPGRVFETEEVIPFSGKITKTLARTVPRANISVRNFPLSADELKKRTRIADGGDTYLFGTTLSGGEKVLIRCRKAIG